jgi:dTMP kinase
MVDEGFDKLTGLFVTFEGGEGSGKSTQARLLAERVEAAGREAIVLREPGGTALGEELRRLILDEPRANSTEAELLMFLAARAELVKAVIRPALDRGSVVICDRFADSTLAYQGYGRGLDIEAVRAFNRWATGGLQPNLTVLLDIPVDIGRQRKRGDDDTFARENDAFHIRVREGYQALASQEPDRWLVLDGSVPQETIAEQVWRRVDQALEPPSPSEV